MMAILGVWGAETILEIGPIEELIKLKIKLLDRYKEVVTKADVDKMRTESILSDVFISSTISLDGKLVNEDGIGNRVACMIYGPKKAIIVAGMNKV